MTNPISSSDYRNMKGKKAAIPVPTEAQEHEAIVRWLAHAYPHAKWNHSQNEGIRHGTQQRVMKAQGVSKGYPDLIVYDWRSPRVLHIEIKRLKGSKTSPEQIEWIGFLNQAGHSAVICHGFDAAKTAIDEFMQV